MVTKRGSDRVFSIQCQGAQSVYLVGDFNNWSTAATPMQRIDDLGIWQVTLRLDPGSYRFGYFVIHTRWFNDETTFGLCEEGKNEHTPIRTDNWNSTITIPGN